MSTFKVGDRVRIVCSIDEKYAHFVGREATIFACLGNVEFNNGTIEHGYLLEEVPCDFFECWGASELEPLTNPGLGAEEEKFVKDLQDSLSDLVKPGEIVEHGDVESAHA